MQRSTGDPDAPLLAEPKREHKEILPFASLVIHRPNSGRINEKHDEIRASIMARGRLLAKLFESSLLIGGCGEVAVSDDEEESEDHRGYKKKAKRGDDEGAFEMDDPQLSASLHSSNNDNDEGFKVLQVSPSRRGMFSSSRQSHY